MTAPPVEITVRYDNEAPGPYCTSHRSAFCQHVIELINNRDDAAMISNAMGRAMLPGSVIGDDFKIAIPVYPELCVWEVVTYTATVHETLGPIAKISSVEPPFDRYQSINRIMLGESAADLAFTLRQNFQDDENIQSQIRTLATHVPVAGRPGVIPRCTASTHGVKYQALLKQVLGPQAFLDGKWDDMAETVYGMLWTYHYHKQCVFCYVKKTLPDAVRVSDLPIEAADTTDYSDLVPDHTSTNRRSNYSTNPYA